MQTLSDYDRPLYLAVSDGCFFEANKVKGEYMWMSERDFHTAIAEAVRAGQPRSGRNSRIIAGVQAIRSGEKD